MRALVLGCGSIGRRHIGNLRAHGVGEILVFDPSRDRADEVVHDYNVRSSRTIEEGFASRPHIALICSPPDQHLIQAREAIAAGCHVFVEKPLSNVLQGTSELLNEGERAQRVIQVGYNLRFHRGIRRLKDLIDGGAVGRPLCLRAEFGQYLPDWRPRDDYRLNYVARAHSGGGIILDGSHELDYVRWLGGEVRSVSCVAGKLSDLEMDAEDTAEVTMRLDGNRIAHVHLDCIQQGYTRNCLVIGESGTLVWDFTDGIRHFSSATGTWTREAISTDVNEMYRDEIGHFLKCAHGEAAPIVDGWSGQRALEIALAAKQSALEGREVVLCQR